MPCVTLEGPDLSKLAAAIDADATLEVTVDVEKKEVRFGTTSLAAGVPETARDALIHGRWDPIGELLEGTEAVTRNGRIPPLHEPVRSGHIN